jgi:hypothetical protein
MGPPIEYRYYKDFMEGKEVYGNIPLWENMKALAFTFMEALLFLALFVTQEKFFSLDDLRSKDFY